MNRPKREPNAAMRQAAAQLHELLTALLDEGFSESQALVIIGQMMSTQMGGGQQP